LRERGYDGGVTQLKDYLRSIRPAHVQAHLQLRFAAIAAQQQRANYIQGPKVNKFVKQLREIIGDVSVHFGNRQCARAFALIEEHDFIGYGRDRGDVAPEIRAN
jgi:predicted negative regulator of RcsB-dependent stress response